MLPCEILNNPLYSQMGFLDVYILHPDLLAYSHSKLRPDYAYTRLKKWLTDPFPVVVSVCCCCWNNFLRNERCTNFGSPWCSHCCLGLEFPYSNKAEIAQNMCNERCFQLTLPICTVALRLKRQSYFSGCSQFKFCLANLVTSPGLRQVTLSYLSVMGGGMLCSCTGQGYKGSGGHWTI